jgi:hypothetical protein
MSNVGTPLVAVLTLLLSASASAQCVGDCDGDNEVEVNELVIGLRIGLAIEPLSACPEFDEGGDQRLSIDELVRGVRFSLDRCPPVSTATQTPTQTPTNPPSLTSTPTATSTRTNPPSPTGTATLVPGDDADGDGLSNQQEIARGTDPLDADSDDDGLPDGDEIRFFTNPLDRDTDDGGRPDGEEVNAGSNPLDPSDDLTAFLPTFLLDEPRFVWDIFGMGEIGSGTNNAFDGGLALAVNGFPFPAFALGTREDTGREIAIGPSISGDFSVSRKVFVPGDDRFVRYLEIVDNLGVTAGSVNLEVSTSLGSDGQCRSHPRPARQRSLRTVGGRARCHRQLRRVPRCGRGRADRCR